MKNRFSSCVKAALALLLALTLGAAGARAQVVNVTASLDDPQIAVGQTTTLRVFAQIRTEDQATTDRIFSWYVDLLNGVTATATADYAALTRTASDQEPATSASGATSGANRTGIHDTFLDRPDAGRLQPVELFAVPVTALAAGQVEFQVRAGTGLDLTDFLVVPADGGATPLTGGDYTAAKVTLTVMAPTVTLAIAPAAVDQFTLSFTPLAGHDHTVQANPDPTNAAGWTDLPGAPHNSGSVNVTNDGGNRFYRIRATPSG